jgi:hypothetical protein
MSNKWRRFEVLLPLQFNDGSIVPPQELGRAVLEVVNQFDAVSHETRGIEGHWRQGGVYYRDNLARIVVDVPDTSETRQWMREYKERWKTLLRQLEIWMVSHPIELE